jgi:hypothetical protein
LGLIPKGSSLTFLSRIKHNELGFPCLLSQPHFRLSVRVKPTLPKVGTWSPPGLPKTQSTIAGVKSPRISALLVSLERSWSVDVQNGLAWAIWTSAAQVMGKRRAGVKLPLWLPTTKSRESTCSRRALWECDTALESYLWGLQLWFRLHPNRRPRREVRIVQSPGTPTRDNFGTPLWESRDKKPFGCPLRGVTPSIL